MKASTVALSVLSLVAGVLSQAETIHLTNCVGKDGEGTPYYSEIDYYPAGQDSQNGELPTNGDYCDWYPSSNYQHWEGNALTCTFPTDVTVTTHIDAAAQSYAEYTWAGWATNGYKDFNCFKDSGRVLYVDDYGEGINECNSVYWCNPSTETKEEIELLQDTVV